MGSKLDSYKWIILGYDGQGKSTSEISRLLIEHHTFPTDAYADLPRAIRRALKRWEGDSVVPSGPVQSAADSLLDDGDDKVKALERDLYQANTKVRNLQNALRSYNNKATLEDRVSSEILKSIRDRPYLPILDHDINKPKVLNVDDGNRHEMLLLVSDAHYPEVVDPEEALGITFGPDTVVSRMQHITDRTVRLIQLHENSYQISKLTVAVLGDMLSGDIHDELEITNDKPMGVALTEMTYMLHDMCSIFAKNLSCEVEVIVLPGNHPRMTKKPRNKQKFNNFEYIMGQFLKGLSQDAYNVIVPKDIIYVHDIMGHKIGMTHGDGSKAASFAGIPFYGIRQRVNALQSTFSSLGRDRLDMLVMGHFHQFLNWTEGDCHVVINGAIKGGDEYSVVTRSSATLPVQGLLTFHERRGWINTERIPLSDIV